MDGKQRKHTFTSQKHISRKINKNIRKQPKVKQIIFIIRPFTWNVENVFFFWKCWVVYVDDRSHWVVNDEINIWTYSVHPKRNNIKQTTATHCFFFKYHSDYFNWSVQMDFRFTIVQQSDQVQNTSERFDAVK